MRTIASENEKALKQANVKMSENGFGGMNIRALELNTMKSGDEITIPSNYVVLEQSMRNSENTARYINVEVKNAGKTRIMPFYPSCLWKSRQEVDENGNPTGTWKRASGAVADFVQDYDDVDEALAAIAAKGAIKVTMSQPFNVLRYGEEEGGKTQKTTVGTFEWA